MTTATLETVDTLAGLNILRDEWNRLAERIGIPLLRHEWFFSAACAFCPPDVLAILTLRSNGKLVALAPLIRTDTLGIEHFEILGSARLLEPTNFLYEDSASLNQLLAAVLDLGKPLILTKLWADPMENSQVSIRCREKSFVTIEHTSSAPWIPIDTPWSEFEARMSSSRRSSIRRANRRLEAKGSVSVELVTRDSVHRGDAVAEAMRIEAAGWKGEEGTAILLDEQLRAFFLTYVNLVAETDMLRLFLLKVGGKAIAMVLGVEYKDRFWVFKIGYDESWRHCSPGIVLMHETIRWAFENKLKAYEFLGSNEEWIHMWTDRVHSFVTHRMYPRSLKGIMWLGFEGNRTLFKKATSYKARAFH